MPGKGSPVFEKRLVGKFVLDLTVGQHVAGRNRLYAVFVFRVRFRAKAFASGCQYPSGTLGGEQTERYRQMETIFAAKTLLDVARLEMRRHLRDV